MDNFGDMLMDGYKGETVGYCMDDYDFRLTGVWLRLGYDDLLAGPFRNVDEAKQWASCPKFREEHPSFWCTRFDPSEDWK